MARPYTQGARAAAAAARRERILSATVELLGVHRYDEITLEAIAERAGVSLATLTRQFSSKAELLIESTRWWTSREEAIREVVPSDVDGVVAVLARRYEAIAVDHRRNIDLEQRYPEMVEGYQLARKSHLDWLATAFARWLPPGGPVRQRRLMALFGATEIYLWWSWRHRLGQSPEEAADALREILGALVGAWERE